MKRGLVVSKSKQALSSLSDILREEGFDEVMFAGDFDTCQALLNESVFDVIIINLPTGDENGLNLASFCAKTTQTCVFVIAPREKSDEVASAMVKDGVLVISRPVDRRLFHHYIVFSDAFKKRMLGLFEENNKLKSMVEEMKLVNRAKMLLMQCLMMSEEQAHRYIEKQAMNMRMSKREIAKQIIKTYEN